MFLGCKDNKKTGEREKAPSTSPMRGSARLPLAWGSDGSDFSDWSDPSDWSDLQYNKAVS